MNSRMTVRQFYDTFLDQPAALALVALRRALLPPQTSSDQEFDLEVRFLDDHADPIRGQTLLENLPEDTVVQLSFRPRTHASSATASPGAQQSNVGPEPSLRTSSVPSEPPAPVEDPDIAEFIRLVDALERCDSLGFVGLKYVRDKHLADPKFTFASDPRARALFMRRMTSERIAETYNVANPESPMHPVTAIRVNRGHPAVVRVLGGEVRALPEPARNQARRLIQVRGTPLSEVILRERR